MNQENYQLQTTNYPLLVIVGETASGKSAMGMELARQFEGEIICADSWTVRREVNIGTAKPSAEDRAEIPHHLLDVVGPDDDFTAAVFKGLGNRAIDDISARGKLPIMVGGTGLYIDGVLYDYGFLPEGDRGAREKWSGQSIDELLKEIHAMGLSTDGIDTRNKRRLIRLLETKGQRATKGSMRPDTLVLGVRVEKAVLDERITRRVDAMIESGLADETKGLAAQYGWECEALKGIGYKEWKDYFNGQITLEETRRRIIKSTQDLAKRQRTWFKRNSSIQWLDDPSEVVEIVTTFLNKKQ